MAAPPVSVPPGGAGAGLLERLRDVARCPRCGDLLRVPQTLWCGHSFCAACLESARHADVATCPLCGKYGIDRAIPSAVLIELCGLLGRPVPTPEAAPQSDEAIARAPPPETMMTFPSGLREGLAGSFARGAMETSRKDVGVAFNRTILSKGKAFVHPPTFVPCKAPMSFTLQFVPTKGFMHAIDWAPKVINLGLVCAENRTSKIKLSLSMGKNRLMEPGNPPRPLDIRSGAVSHAVIQVLCKDQMVHFIMYTPARERADDWDVQRFSAHLPASWTVVEPFCRVKVSGVCLVRQWRDVRVPPPRGGGGRAQAEC